MHFTERFQPQIASLVGHDARVLSLFVAYIPARNLEQWRDGDHYFSGDTNDAAIILKHMSSALSYLERMRLAHNDIKPANILYTRHEAPGTGPYQKVPPGAILIDFGLAGESGKKANTGGSPWYVAPEYMDRGLRGTPGDVFALGVVMLYVMRCIILPEKEFGQWLIRDIPAKKPQALKTMGEWLDRVARARRPLLEGVSGKGEAKLRTLVLMEIPEDGGQQQKAATAWLDELEEAFGMDEGENVVGILVLDCVAPK